MESHGKSIKPILRQLITWTPLKEGITLLKLFRGISTGLEALLQLGMVVRRYLYVNIILIARQMAASKMMELKPDFHNSLQSPHGRLISLSCHLTYN
jgi:hypothetical protein